MRLQCLVFAVPVQQAIRVALNDGENVVQLVRDQRRNVPRAQRVSFTKFSRFARLERLSHFFVD